MAITERETVIPNKGRPKKKRFGAAARSKHRKRGNGHLIGYTLNRGAGRKTAKSKGATTMAKTKRKAGSHAGAHKKTKYKKNRGHMFGKSSHGHTHHKKGKVQRNIGGSRGGSFGMGDYVINALFVAAGGLGTKLITQMVLQDKNTGVMGYGVNALTGAALWFLTDRGLKNKAASMGVISGTILQIIIRLINDYTPFGQYVSQLGVGDYQAQAFLTPQVLVDPVNSAQIRFPPALMAAAYPPPAQTMPAQAGVSGFDPLYGSRSDLY